MRSLAVILCFLISFGSQAQGLGISSSSYFSDFSTLNYYFNSLPTVSGNNRVAMRNPIVSIGISQHSALYVGRALTFSSDNSLELFLPSAFHDANDSLFFIVKGYHLTTSFLGGRIINKGPWLFVLGPGIDWGILKIKRIHKDGTGNGLYKNTFASPLARAELQYSTGRSLFSFRVFYRYDMSSLHWQTTDSSLPEMPEFAWTGFGFQIGFSLYIHKSS
ncbi:MAG TPA: hypothetical protein VL651_12995 [Bacteroidia bacterium]|jgi:hypothetical protein|nr:hypothetical protein [Bacteroidia bacterium]